MQKVDIDLLNVLSCMTLITFLLQTRDTFDDIEVKAKSYVETKEYKEATRRTKRRKRFLDESSIADTKLSARDEFRIETFYCIVDCLIAELCKGLSACSTLYKLFGFSTEFESLSVSDLRKCVQRLVETYPIDLEPSFIAEFIQFAAFLAAYKDITIRYMAELLRVDEGLLHFPKCCNSRTNNSNQQCEDERSFSALSRVKNQFRITMSQDRLSALGLLYIESDVLRELEFSDLIDDFAKNQCRKRDI